MNLRRRLKTGCFVLEGLNALAAAYYFNYLFFYMQEHFGFGNERNLLLTAEYGFLYMFAAWGAGRLGHRHGYFFFLRLGFSIVLATMLAGALVPKFLGYSRAAMMAQVAIVAVWTLGLCGIWPMLQALLTKGESPRVAAQTAGIYNIIWAVAAAIAYLTGGAMLDRFHGEILFWTAAGLHLVQLLMLGPLQKLSIAASAQPAAQNSTAESVAELNPRPIAKARTFLHLAWLANPFAYVAIYGMLPVVPKLSERLGLTPTSAGLVYSVWFWVRLGAFIWFWLWPGWHYRFSLLLGAFVAMIASFATILLCTNIWVLIAVQVVFGIAVGLIYYSSLFYSMDAGESTGKRGGVHEAAIGVGTTIGPVAGAVALHWYPGQINAVAWYVCGLLAVGLVLFLLIRFRTK
jgi:predicted MFS family arabinose efflux permease